MPEHKETVSLPQYDSTALLHIAYAAFGKLNWSIKYAGPISLIGYTPKTWKQWDDEITVEALDGTLHVTSKMIHGEMADVMKRNRKNVAQFLQAFEACRAEYQPGNHGETDSAIVLLQDQTQVAAEKEFIERQEVERVMKLSGSRRYVTIGLMVANAIVFLAMILNGVSFLDPTTVDLVDWGGNYRPFTTEGEWWRLGSCLFIHVGFLHLVINMYALYMAGHFLEPMMGKPLYILAYLISGVAASVTSLLWHYDKLVVSAGASGAVFGLYGVFLALLLTKLIPTSARKPLMSAVGFFVAFNIVGGMKDGIDNAAHVGGILCGMVIGFLMYFPLKRRALAVAEE
jgi:rhomboid protease GluP